MDTDGLEPEGVYAGTSNGQLYASADGGDHWQRLPGTLPPVLSVTSVVCEGGLRLEPLRSGCPPHCRRFSP
jgi:hypothetical protein